LVQNRESHASQQQRPNLITKKRTGERSAEAMVATVRHFGWERVSVLAVHEGPDRALLEALLLRARASKLIVAHTAEFVAPRCVFGLGFSRAWVRDSIFRGWGYGLTVDESIVHAGGLCNGRICIKVPEMKFLEAVHRLSLVSPQSSDTHGHHIHDQGYAGGPARLVRGASGRRGARGAAGGALPLTLPGVVGHASLSIAARRCSHCDAVTATLK